MNQKVWITGSSTGLGLLTARNLIKDGFDVYLHARNAQKAKEALQKCPGAKGVITGDLSSMNDLLAISQKVNQLGKFSTIIHNAGVYTSDRHLTFLVNVLAPYVLTSLIHKPAQLIYIASNMHMGASLPIKNIADGLRYSSSKLAVLLLMKKAARIFPNVKVSAVDPGWVPTRMGGAGASDPLIDGYETQVWLTEKRDEIPTGTYYFHKREQIYDQRADSAELQDQLTDMLQKISGYAW